MLRGSSFASQPHHARVPHPSPLRVRFSPLMFWHLLLRVPHTPVLRVGFLIRLAVPGSANLPIGAFAFTLVWSSRARPPWRPTRDLSVVFAFLFLFKRCHTEPGRPVLANVGEGSAFAVPPSATAPVLLLILSGDFAPSKNSSRYNPLRGIYEIHRRQTQKGPTQDFSVTR
jgi:hypothetical protein